MANIPYCAMITRHKQQNQRNKHRFEPKPPVSDQPPPNRHCSPVCAEVLYLRHDAEILPTLGLDSHSCRGCGVVPMTGARTRRLPRVAPVANRRNMQIYIFTSVRNSSVRAFTSDCPAGNLPIAYAPWQSSSRCNATIHPSKSQICAPPAEMGGHHVPNFIPLAQTRTSDLGACRPGGGCD